MKVYAFDIETIPNEAMIPFLEEPEAPKNIKDPVKIAAAIAEKKQEQIADMPKKPFLGRIACYAIIGDDDYEETEYLEDLNNPDKSEAEMIDCALNFITGVWVKKDILVTWNGSGFDLPFLYGRAMALGVEIRPACPTLTEIGKRYVYQPHCDLMRAITGWDYLKLNTCAAAVLGEQKAEFDVNQILPYFKAGKHQEVIDYCKRDTALTYRLYKKVQPYLIRPKVF